MTNIPIPDLPVDPPDYGEPRRKPRVWDEPAEPDELDFGDGPMHYVPRSEP